MSHAELTLCPRLGWPCPAFSSWDIPGQWLSPSGMSEPLPLGHLGSILSPQVILTWPLPLCPLAALLQARPHTDPSAFCLHSCCPARIQPWLDCSIALTEGDYSLCCPKSGPGRVSHGKRLGRNCVWPWEISTLKGKKQEDPQICLGWGRRDSRGGMASVERGQRNRPGATWHCRGLK